jgi:hypothetical protein
MAGNKPFRYRRPKNLGLRSTEYGLIFLVERDPNYTEANGQIASVMLHEPGEKPIWVCAIIVDSQRDAGSLRLMKLRAPFRPTGPKDNGAPTGLIAPRNPWGPLILGVSRGRVMGTRSVLQAGSLQRARRVS